MILKVMPHKPKRVCYCDICHGQRIKDLTKEAPIHISVSHWGVFNEKGETVSMPD